MLCLLSLSLSLVALVHTPPPSSFPIFKYSRVRVRYVQVPGTVDLFLVVFRAIIPAGQQKERTKREVYKSYYFCTRKRLHGCMGVSGCVSQ